MGTIKALDLGSVYKVFEHRHRVFNNNNFNTLYLYWVYPSFKKELQAQYSNQSVTSVRTEKYMDNNKQKTNII